MKTGKMILGIIGALLSLIIAQLLAQLIAGLLSTVRIPAALCNSAAGILYIGFAYLLLRLFTEKGLKMKLPELGIPKFGLRIKWMLTALLLPVLVIGSYFLFPGELVKGLTAAEAMPFLCAGIFFIGLGAGAVEEMVFRGIIMNLLDKRFGKLSAVLLPSLLFGAVHIIGMDFSFFSCVQVIAAGTFVGIMFSLIALESGSVWNSAIVHALWNIITSGGLIHIGTAAEEYYLFSYILKTRSFAVTGGEFGLEASILSIAGYVLVSIIAYTAIRKALKQ